MENGLEVTEGPLVNRIKYIMHIFGKQRESVDDVMEVMQEVAVKKVKEKDKDCEIYWFDSVDGSYEYERIISKIIIQSNKNGFILFPRVAPKTVGRRESHN